MIMGTASDVGKSVVAAAVGRLAYRRGIRVAPFKAQNMSLNSFVTIEGGEMARAQVVQAHACGVLPHVDMNPILLKPESDHCSQVVVHGKVWGRHDAWDYFAHREELFGAVSASYQRLARSYDAVIVEGAGSAAEVNLRDKDLVNWPIAEMADASVLLVADIDRGGVFAQTIGTLDLLEREERRRIAGIIVNKFRGDGRLFADGVAFIEDRTGVPVLGVIPFVRTLRLDQEDSLARDQGRHAPFAADKVNVAVVLLPHMSNFTDFDALAAEPDIVLRYATTPSQLAGADVVFLPGSKVTAADLDYLIQAGFPSALGAHIAAGGELVGICGGYQMLGRELSDPCTVEHGATKTGLSFLDIVTEFRPGKKTAQVEAVPSALGIAPDCTVRGYEIHMGQTRRGAASPCFRILRRISASSEAGATQDERDDGACNEDRRVWGTYIHGVFDAPGFRRLWINQARARKRLPPLPVSVSEDVSKQRSAAIDEWADHCERYLRLGTIYTALAPAPAR
jgi:adenosylcobyric acid synthase